MRILEIQKEYERILGIFKDIDENQLALLDGAIWECARLRIELNNLHKLMGETGAVSYNPSNPKMQKELPISKVIVKTRANYLNYIAKLSNILGKNIEEDEDNDLLEFE
ncbi:hypothetical protein Q604_UNBC07086G0002 [human gut metagenome]|uniref:Phage protein n=1 Tax=human gut metagenome TaxID=408170 RepID=W1Y8S3_9ZZZZ|nr:zinc-binding protein [Intestinibacter bartlettii]